MKKSIKILFAAIALISLTGISGYAQVAKNNAQTGSTNEDGIFIKTTSGISGAVNGKAERNFKKDYRNAVAAEWFTLKDNSLLCRFTIDGIPHRAFYSVHGQWLGTVSSYEAGKLDRELYDKIKSVYYNSNIVFVNQVDKPVGKTIYVVDVQDEKYIRKLRLDGDEIEIVQEFEKQ
jgi:hypothetical protein